MSSCDSMTVIGATFLRGCLLRSRSGDKYRFSESGTVNLHLPLGRALQYLEYQLKTSPSASCGKLGRNRIELTSHFSPC